MRRPVGSANIQNQFLVSYNDFFFKILDVKALFVISQENGKGWTKAEKEKLITSCLV